MLAVLATAAASVLAAAVDGTNVWTGASGGGRWKDPTNWRAESAAGYSVEELFRRYAVYDLRALAPGAVVDFDYADGNVYNVQDSAGDMFIAGLVLAGGPGDVWTVARAPEAGRVRFASQAEIRIDGGRLDFHPVTSVGYDYPTMPLVKEGTGTLRICQNDAFFWEATHAIREGSLSLTNNYNLKNSGFILSAGARLCADFGSNRVAGVSSVAGEDHAATRIEIASGATLDMMSGFTVSPSGFDGDLAGTGRLRVSGGNSFPFTRGGRRVPHAFSGLLSVASADLVFGTAAKPVGVNPAASAEIECGGWLRFSAGQRLASIFGAGVDGGIAWPANATLTVGGPASTAYSGRLVGGTFAKVGAGTLALDGEVACAGDVRVGEGTLAVRRGFYRAGLAAAWRFEDAEDIGADASPAAAFGLEVRPGSVVAPELVDGGIVGKALHFDGGSTAGGKLARAAATAVTGYAPCGGAPFTFSFWMRPEQGCGKGPNFIHVDSIKADGSLNWGNGFYFGSVMDGNTEPFRALGFYTCDWSRDGKKGNTNKVAVATFSRSLVDGEWHHVVGTYSNRIMRLYVDGELRDTVTRANNLAVPSSVGVEFGNWSATDGNHKYNGCLDEVQWLRGAWSADDVRREFLSRRPAADDAALVPAPLAHWTFDALEDAGGDKVFRDAGSHGFDLLSVPSNGTHHAVLEAMTYPDDRGSKAARLAHATSHIRLRAGGERLAAALPAGGSFTVSLRSGQAANGVFLILGDGTAAGSLRFSHEGCPRVMGVFPCSSSATTFGAGGVARNDGGATWFLHTVAYDADSGTVCLYEDGVPYKVLAGKKLSLQARDLVLGANVLADGVASAFCRNVAFDDLRIWNRALDPSQVKALARTFRAGAEAVSPVLPPSARVEVAQGARLRVMGGTHEVESVDGAGTVEVLGGAELAPRGATNAADLAGLSFVGAGTLRLPEGITFERDGGVPAVRPVLSLAGRARLPERARVVFTRSSAGEPPAAGLYPLVAAAAFDEPSSWSGWTAEPAGERQVTFAVRDGVLTAHVGEPDHVWASRNARLNIASLDAYFYPHSYTTSWALREGSGNGDADSEGRYHFTLNAEGSSSGATFNGTFLPRVTGSNTVTSVWTMTPDRDITLGALAVGIALSVETFGGGRVMLDSYQVNLPEQQTSSTGLATRNASALEVYARDGTRRLRIDFHSTMSVLVQDNRSKGRSSFSLRIMPKGGATFTAGTTYVFGYDITLPGNVEFGPRPQRKIVAGQRWMPMPGFRWIRPGSALDFSALRGTDAPAGRHGRVVCRGRHFEFANLPGVPQRFYGVNICRGANVPSGNEAVFAANLARMGYNAIRYHHHETELVKNTGDPGATALNAAAMNRFDRLVAACVTNGIYITTDLFVNRSPITWRSLGIDRDGSLETADMKMLVLVHEPAISNLMVFTRNFLGHVNPYLGRSLAHEPAMVGISFVNEGAVSRAPAQLCADYPPWRDAWGAWIAAKKAADPATYGSVSAEPPSSATRHFCRFVQERELAFAARMKALVRDELGCLAPLTSLNGTSFPLAYMQVRAAAYDYADDHFYVDHPTFLQTSWQLPSSLDNINPLKNPDLGVPECAARRLFDRPYTLTEFNFSGPGRYRGIGGMATGAIGAAQDWGGIWRFAWSHDESGITKPQTRAMNYFDVSGDPLALAAERAAICLFLRRDLPPLGRAYVARVPPAIVAGPADGNTEILTFPCRWAGWHAQLGHVVSNAVPAGAIDAGTYPGIKSIADSAVRTALGYGNEVPAGAGGALDIDSNTGAFRLDTPRTSGGFAETGEIDAGAVAFELEGAAATVWASSLDGKPLAASGRILLTHLTDVQNSNITYGDDTLKTLLSWGALPHLMRTGRAYVRMRLDPGAFAVYALAPDGSRVRAVPSSVSGGVLSFTADVAAAAEATWLYEIVRRPPSPCIILR